MRNGSCKARRSVHRMANNNDVRIGFHHAYGVRKGFSFFNRWMFRIEIEDICAKPHCSRLKWQFCSCARFIKHSCNNLAVHQRKFFFIGHFFYCFRLFQNEQNFFCGEIIHWNDILLPVYHRTSSSKKKGYCLHLENSILFCYGNNAYRQLKGWTPADYTSEWYTRIILVLP